MIHQTPKELIQEYLDEYKKAKRKSDEAYAAGQIPATIHDTHLENLVPKIEQFSYALQILNKYT